MSRVEQDLSPRQGDTWDAPLRTANHDNEDCWVQLQTKYSNENNLENKVVDLKAPKRIYVFSSFC